MEEFPCLFISLIKGFSSGINIDDNVSLLYFFSPVNNLSQIFLILCFRLKTVSSHH